MKAGRVATWICAVAITLVCSRSGRAESHREDVAAHPPEAEMLLDLDVLSDEHFADRVRQPDLEERDLLDWLESQDDRRSGGEPRK